jgi:adenylate cyclase class 2
MAVDGVEVECKFFSSEEASEKILTNVSRVGKQVSSSEQVDEYFNSPSEDYMKAKKPFKWLSLRKRSGKVILNYKHFFPETAENFTHCEEFETKVDDFEKFKGFLLEVGFKSLVVVEKSRKTFVVNEEFEIAFDNIKELGLFIEVEALKDFGGIEKTREKLFEFSKEIGINVAKVINEGYPFLLMKEKGLL